MRRINSNSTKWIDINSLDINDIINTSEYGIIDYGMYFTHRFNSVSDFLLSPTFHLKSKMKINSKKFLKYMWSFYDVRIIAALYYIFWFVGINRISEEAFNRLKIKLKRCSIENVTYATYSILNTDPAMYNDDAPCRGE